MTPCDGTNDILIGKLLDNYDAEETPLCLDLKSFNRHVFISGSTGSGKTVLLRRIIEQAALKGVSSIVFDIKGDLAKLAIPRTSFYDWELEQHSENELIELIQTFYDNVDVRVSTVGVNEHSLNLGPFSISLVGHPKETIKDLAFTKAEGIANALPLPSSAVMPITTYLYHVLLKASLKRYEISTPENLLYILNNDLYKPSPKEAQLTNTIRTKLIQSLQHIQAGPLGDIYGSGKPFSLDYLLEQEKPSIHVISLQAIDHDDRVRLIGNTLHRIFQWVKEHPFPELKLLVTIDELLGLAPPVKKTSAKESLTILSTQGRQYGLGLILATQQPVQVDHMILSQFNTLIIGRHPGRNDREYIRTILKGTEAMLTDLDDVLANISTARAGEFYVLRVGNPPTHFKALVGYSEFEGPPLTPRQLHNLVSSQHEETITETLPLPENDDDTENTDETENFPDEELPLPPDEQPLPFPQQTPQPSDKPEPKDKTPPAKPESKEPILKISDIDYFTIDKGTARLYKAARETLGDIEVLKKKTHEVYIYQQQVILEFKPGYILKNSGPKQPNNQITAFTDWQILPATFPSILPSKQILQLARTTKFHVNVRAPIPLETDDIKIIESLTKHRTRELYDPKNKIHEKIKQTVTIDLREKLPNYQKLKLEYQNAENSLNEKIKELDNMMNAIKNLETQIQQKQKAMKHTKMPAARTKLENDIQAITMQIENKKQVIQKHVGLAKTLKDQRKTLQEQLNQAKQQLKTILQEYQDTPTPELLSKIIIRRRVLSLQVYELDVKSLSIKDADSFVTIWIPGFKKLLTPCWRCLYSSIEDAYGVPITLCEECGKPICQVHTQTKKKLLGKEMRVCKPSCNEA